MIDREEENMILRNRKYPIANRILASKVRQAAVVLRYKNQLTILSSRVQILPKQTSIIAEKVFF
jgi:hypothetical protein